MDRETLLAAGFSLVIAGLVLRGFASDARRRLARHRQHLLDARTSAAAGRGGEMERPPGWFTRHAGKVANAVLAAGALLVVAALTRR
ncbi:MAG TPA: hypothetical protein VHD61_10455 [Lacunisphaera sp.]|nr:hypothetical protein [Lacunisphaera sp.]